MKQIITKFETIINIINYVLCDLYACKNLMIKSLLFKFEDFYLRRRFKVKYLSKHYISDMERKYDMEFFENRISFMVFMVLGIPIALFFAKLPCPILHINKLYIFYAFQSLIAISLLKFIFYKKKSKYNFKIFDRIKAKNIFQWRCITLCVIVLDLVLFLLLLRYIH